MSTRPKSSRLLTISSLVGILLLSAQPSHGQKADPDRGGFTALLTMGYGMQSSDAYGGDWTGGLAGLNLGIGGFGSRDVAIMFRFSGTSVNYETNTGFYTYETNVVSGVAVLDVQGWVTNRLNVEGGAGYGFLDDDEGVNEMGVGVLLAAGYSVLLRGKFSLQVGIEYAPVFLDHGGTINNIGFNVGFQFL